MILWGLAQGSSKRWQEGKERGSFALSPLSLADTHTRCIAGLAVQSRRQTGKRLGTEFREEARGENTGHVCALGTVLGWVVE